MVRTLFDIGESDGEDTPTPQGPRPSAAAAGGGGDESTGAAEADAIASSLRLWRVRKFGKLMVRASSVEAVMRWPAFRISVKGGRPFASA